MRVQTGGRFRFPVNIEALTAASVPGKGSPGRTPLDGGGGRCPTCKPVGKL